MNYYYNPVRLYWGTSCMDNIQDNLQELEVHNILLIKWSETALNNIAGTNLLKILDQYQVEQIVFTKSNPDIQDLYQIYQERKGKGPDVILAVGGGSVLDMAKSLAAILDSEYDSVDDLREAIRMKKTGKPCCPWIGIPTTAGTGSEVTCWATVWDKEKDSKLSLENKRNYAYAAYIEPEFTMSMPMKLVVSSALDAVAHATESYWAKAHNMVSDIYALKAIRGILSNLGHLIDNSDEKDYKIMAQSSMLAGRAFSNTKTTACHAISYPLTLHYGIPHGIAVSMLLPAMLEINKSKIEELEPLMQAYEADTLKEAGEKIIHLLEKADIPYKLSQWNVKKEDIPEIAEKCFTKGRMENNPVDLSKEDVEKILESIW